MIEYGTGNVAFLQFLSQNSQNCGVACTQYFFCSRVSIICLYFSHGNEGIFYGYDGAYPAHKAIGFVICDKS